MNTFTVTVFELYQEDGKKLQLTMGNTLNDSFVTIFSQKSCIFTKKTAETQLRTEYKAGDEGFMNTTSRFTGF